MYDYRQQRRAWRMQRRIARDQRRAWRRQRRGFYGGAGGTVWLIILLILLFNSHWLWFLWLPLFFLGIPFFFFVVRPMIFGWGNPTMNQQPPYNQQFYQPPVYQQPEQPVYQPPSGPQEQPVYEPYNQGYRPAQPDVQPNQPAREYEQQNQYVEPQGSQQYEEPLTMYPQE